MKLIEKMFKTEGVILHILHTVINQLNSLQDTLIAINLASLKKGLNIFIKDISVEIY